ncbi:VacJ family lipoprotein [Malaciobacter mytili]|uniref:ABC transporter n=1 Tax=Malaciobacter mytili LMG 24559 TaxID=1032238 RepID=A0AAX2AKU1_9BACT|nr:VacJ family lipoprotein [Malaciobacter mytili]AXH14780.1 lipid asymmetry ABC transporter MlaABCDEF, lipoprotein MlaA [Malaciobacter mytili LMG 24559]RXI44123.1 ABC transporter [Malaciobacter mytili]RXK16848.1 ABC transporter [Malaciobacter mytili LMG 24559]
MRRIKVVLIFFLLCFYANAQEINSKEFNVNNQFEEFSNEFESPKEDFDPLERYNRAMTSFNDTFYVYISKPVITTYKDVVPSPVRTGVSNFFTNLGFPIRFINNLLQLKFQNSWEELQLFLLNSTFGVAGLIDVAKENNFDLKHHHEDFGQTLATWGVGDGFPIVLPFWGNSNLRDFLGFLVDDYANPLKNGHSSFYLANSFEESLALRSYKLVNNSSFTLKVYEKIKKDAIDLYPYLKELHKQKRDKEIKE